METSDENLICINISGTDEIVTMYLDIPVLLLKTDHMIQEILCIYWAIYVLHINLLHIDLCILPSAEYVYTSVPMFPHPKAWSQTTLIIQLDFICEMYELLNDNLLCSVSLVT